VSNQSKAKSVRSPLRSEQRELTRRRLCKSARTLFEQHGFAQTSIEDIAAHASVARATVYLHYQGKDALLNALLDEDWEAQAHYVELLAAAPNVNAAVFRQWLVQLVRANRARVKSTAIYGAFLNKDPEFGARYMKHRERMIEILGRRFPSFATAKDDDRMNTAAHCVVLQIDQFCWAAAQDQFRQEERAIDLMTDLFTDFLCRGAPPSFPLNTAFPTH
jgi:AcrR family transcriptional regulator